MGFLVTIDMSLKRMVVPSQLSLPSDLTRRCFLSTGPRSEVNQTGVLTAKINLSSFKFDNFKKLVTVIKYQITAYFLCNSFMKLQVFEFNHSQV